MGFALAERLSQAGARVVLADVDKEGAVAAVKRLREGGAEAVEAGADVTRPGEGGARGGRGVGAFGGGGGGRGGRSGPSPGQTRSRPWSGAPSAPSAGSTCW